VLTNERLSFICKHVNNRYCHAGRGGKKKVGDKTTGFLFFHRRLFLREIPFSPQVLYTTIYISGGGNDPPRETKKRVPLMRFLRGEVNGPPRKKKMGAWPRLYRDSTRGRSYTSRASGCPCYGIPFQAPAQGSLRTLRAGRLRRADLQPYLGLANIVTDLVRGSGGAWHIVTDAVRGS
jgi:hypothetical protein